MRKRENEQEIKREWEKEDVEHTTCGKIEVEERIVGSTEER